MTLIFDSTIFNQAIFDAAAASWTEGDLDVFNRRFMEEVGNYAEAYERATGPRPTFSCLKATLRTQLTSLNALMPTNRATLTAAMTNVPAAYKDILADHFLTENQSGYCRNG